MCSSGSVGTNLHTFFKKFIFVLNGRISVEYKKKRKVTYSRHLIGKSRRQVTDDVTFSQ